MSNIGHELQHEPKTLFSIQLPALQKRYQTDSILCSMLNILLLQAGRQADLEKSFIDSAYQQQLLKEFGLIE